MVRPLTKRDKSGALLKRQSTVESTIVEALQQGLDSATKRAWLTNPSDRDFLPMECLVYLIRDAWKRRDEPAMNALMPPFLARCEQMLKAKIRDSVHPNATKTREEVLSNFSLLFVEDATEVYTDELDYFECRFNRSFRFFRIDYLRRESRRTAHLEQFADQDAPLCNSDDKSPGVLRDEYRVPATQVASILHKERLAAINRLPPDQRKAVYLCGVLGLKEESDDPDVITAATLCEVTGRTIRNRLTRAAAALSNFKGDS